jgi:hypothetical protein
LEPGLVGGRFNPPPLLAHLDLVLDLDVVVDLFEEGISEGTILREKICPGPRPGRSPRPGFLLQALKNFERLRPLLHFILFRRFGMRYGPAILIWIVVGMASVYGQAKKPSIVFDSITKDAGKVTQGETVKQVFTFTNKGSGTLEIINVQPT